MDALAFVRQRVNTRVRWHVFVRLLECGAQYGLSYQFKAFEVSGSLLDTMSWALLVLNFVVAVISVNIVDVMLVDLVNLELTQALRHIESRSATGAVTRYDDYVSTKHRADLASNPLLAYVYKTARAARVNYQIYLGAYTVASMFFMGVCFFTPAHIPWFSVDLIGLVYIITFSAVEGIAVLVALLTLPARLPDLREHKDVTLMLSRSLPRPYR